MGVFVTITDFTGRFQLPTIASGGTAESVSYINKIEGFIDTYEKQCLNLLLSKPEALKFINDKGQNAPFLDLKDGATFDVSGKTFKYEGIKPVLIPYIYYYIVTQSPYNLSETGFSTAKDGSIWNEKIEQIWDIDFISNYGLIGITEDNSAYAYLTANTDLFIDFVFTEIGKRTWV